MAKIQNIPPQNYKTIIKVGIIYVFAKYSLNAYCVHCEFGGFKGENFRVPGLYNLFGEIRET